MAGVFPDLMKKIYINAKFQEHKCKISINTNRYTSRYITVKPLRTREKSLESSKRKVIHDIPRNSNMINA